MFPCFILAIKLPALKKALLGTCDCHRFVLRISMLLHGVALGWCAIRAPLRPASLRHHVLAMQEVNVEAQRGLVIGAARAAFVFADADGSGSLDREEVLNLMERMMGEGEDDGQASSRSSIPMDEVEFMFTKYSREANELSYENFVLLLTECEADSALFTGLLSFAEGAVSAGVKDAFDVITSTAVGRQTHILDDGSAIWRESIEAAFELCDAERTGEVNAARPERPGKTPRPCTDVRSPALHRSPRNSWRRRWARTP